ncbi:response regulator receiver protein [Alteromonas sp. KUL49]|uniref:response regulator receiver protein n=1 Tax=Alteromonas sp. KUL49 TaxID=2480798 RepID=UPI00102F2481|nr:response regulator receiver protein [Alteromonas sp. KUL49]TAP39709.1 response regulator receiver protein [Alteromonas sp. KUL49]GEA11699.1 hypothetical protein KUL49_20740 [Alteromonas sp. KUL49]
MGSLLKVCLLTAILASNVAFAENVWHTSTLAKVYPFGDGRLVITFNKDSESCLSTATPQKYHYAKVGENGVTQEGLDMMLATALAAGMSGKSVSINFDNSTEKCYINRLQIKF